MGFAPGVGLTEFAELEMLYDLPVQVVASALLRDIRCRTWRKRETRTEGSDTSGCGIEFLFC